MKRLIILSLLCSGVLLTTGCNLTDEAPPEDAVCGDGFRDDGEVCDDGNTDDGDYCAADCQSETGSCGDGTQQDGEACDDGNTDDGDYCAADCQSITAVCGDDDTTAGEACDDGNTDDGDYCSADCTSETGSCGDGTKQDNEACDDGNNDDGDYCSFDCRIADGSCGDGIKQDSEACDDGNTEGGDYCAPDCSAFTGRCGDGTEQDNEACDDGNNDDGDYCASDCRTVTGSCGDGVLQAGEECDDGNGVAGDLCDPGCVDVEFVVDGEVTFTEDRIIPAGARVRFTDGSRLIVRTNSLTIKEGAEFLMGDSSSIVLDGAPLRIDGNEDHPVSFASESAVCGSWFGFEAQTSGSLLSMSHVEIEGVTRAIGSVGVSVSLADVSISDVCGVESATVGGVDGEDLYALDLRGAEFSINRLSIDKVYGQDGSTTINRDGGGRGGKGSTAGGVVFYGAQITAFNDVSISTIQGGDGGDGGPSQRDVVAGGVGGDGGEARGVSIFGAVGDVRVRRIRITDLIAGDAGDGGAGVNGIPGISTTSGDGGSGGDGSDGGDGGEGGLALGITPNIDGAVVLENALIHGLTGGDGGAGGNGGNGGDGGDGGLTGFGGAGGDGGDAGRHGAPGVAVGAIVVNTSATVLHFTISQLYAGGFSSHGLAGLGGSVGRGGGRPGGGGADGRVPSDRDVFAAVGVIFESNEANAVARIAYSAFSVVGQVLGLVSAGVDVTADYNLMHGFESSPYVNVTPGVGNVGGDPLFVDAASGNFSPRSGSPLVNAAETSVVNEDILNRSRDNLPDIGAFEYIP